MAYTAREPMTTAAHLSSLTVIESMFTDFSRSPVSAVSGTGSVQSVNYWKNSEIPYVAKNW